MNTSVPSEKSCAKCGTALPADAPKGVCPQCELHGVLDLLPGGDETAALTSSLSHPVGEGVRKTGEGRRFGNYELLEEIARGGMGIVYRARQVNLDRIVAVKMILAGQFAGKQFVQRFLAEASATAVLQHPNIVAVHDVGVEDGQHYFSMDFVEGQNLAQLVGQRPLPPAKAARYVKLIAEAIHYAHGQGILHRDLKPSNVLVDASDQPRVTDFGLAKRLTSGSQLSTHDSQLTQTGQVLGSPGFMPPEQASADRGKVSRASDVYGLGAILYFLLTARAPFQAESLEAIITQVLNAEPISPRLLNPVVPPDLETICLKCLEKEPARRYSNALTLADELGRFLRDEPIQARPVSRPEKAWRWCRRKPVIATLSATTALLLLAVAIGSPIAAFRISRERNVAVNERARAQSAQGIAEAERRRADGQAQKASQSQQQSRRLLYAADMNLAQQSLNLNNLGKARRLLDRHRPQPGEEDLRGWEWRYLWHLTRNRALVTLTNQSSPPFTVSFSPDGTRLAVGCENGRVDLWEVPGRRWVRALTDREQSHVGWVAFSPVRNLLAATSERNVVTLYDLDSGRESLLWRASEQGEWNVRDLSFSQDGSKLVIYAGSTGELGDKVWVVNVSSSQIEGPHPTACGNSPYHGAARLSPDNRHLYLARSDYLKYRYSIQCIDLATGKELWQTERERDFGLTALAISPDGRVLASGSGFEDANIRVWEAATGRLLVRLDGHTGWVSDLAFTRDGRRLISASADQSIRFWDTSTWTEKQVLRGHTDEVHAVAISEPAHLVASAGKDGNLMLWQEDGKSAADGYRRLTEDPWGNEVSLDHSRVLLLPLGKPPELVDLKRDSPRQSLPELGSSVNVLGWFSTNILCHWNGTNQILVSELRGSEFIQRGAITVDSGTRPPGVAYNATRQLLAWAEGTNSASVYLASLAAPGRRIELRSDVPGLVPFRFSENGNYLWAMTGRWDSLRTWNVETGQIVASINETVRDPTFAAGGRVLVVAIAKGNDHEIRFYDLVHPGRAPQRAPGRNFSQSLAVSPDGGLVASSTWGGLVRLFDPAKGELIEDLHGHISAVFGIAFSPDGRRLISASGGREAVKLWDVGTRQELLTLGGIGSPLFAARWSADGDVILAGGPWQAWRAPSWAEIEAAEELEK